MKVSIKEDKLVVELGEVTVDEFAGLAMATFHIDDLKKLNNKLNEYIEKYPQLMCGGQ